MTDHPRHKRAILKALLVKMSLLMGALFLAVAAVQSLTGVELIPAAAVIGGGLWAAWCLGAWWIAGATVKGPWRAVHAWFWAAGLRVVAALGAVAAAVKVLGCDPGAVVVCLAVLYLPTLFYETRMVVKCIQSGGGWPSEPDGVLRSEVCA